ncbi:hypothetical protein TRIATDRAFT_299893, partial [Trichoderma atroviride IMI 206040]
MREKGKHVLLTLTVGLERIRRNSEREKGRWRKGRVGGNIARGKGGRRRKCIMYSRKRKRGSEIWAIETRCRRALVNCLYA